MTRISTAAFFNQNTTRLLNLQSELARKQDQIATGVKISTPSEGPLEFNAGQRAQNSIFRIEQYERNMTFARGSLSEKEVAFEAAGESMKNVAEKLVQAKSSFVSLTDRKIIADELRSRRDEILSVANQKDTSGGFMFSGTRSDVPAFQRDAVGELVYAGTPSPNSGITFQVSDGRTLDLSINGQDAFVDTDGTGKSYFQLLEESIAILEDPSVEDTLPLLNEITDAMDRTFDNLLIARGRIGNKIEAMEALESGFQTIKVELQNVIKNETSTDLTETISDLAQLDVLLQASQRSFGQISRLSLFDFL